MRVYFFSNGRFSRSTTTGMLFLDADKPSHALAVSFLSSGIYQRLLNTKVRKQNPAQAACKMPTAERGEGVLRERSARP